eukprot:gb/GFBE01073781.1/.p1 GENE.gb/GFBE01073781.1/~~gb/GFBE01073781.1/.p1  ORF type:complete len:384 (+),score=85.48 gb/GFBE01073781.1/:1-1152(+)
MKGISSLTCLLCFGFTSARKTTNRQQTLVVLEERLAQAPALGADSLEGIESSLLAMAGEGATPELKPFVDQIFNLTVRMKSEVEKQATESNRTLTAHWEDFKSCRYDGADEEGLKERSARHRACREVESSVWSTMQGCESICEVKNNTAQSYCEAFRTINVYPPTGDCKWSNNHMKSTLPYMMALRDDYLQRYRHWAGNKSLCSNHTSRVTDCYASCKDQEKAYYDKKAECDRYQSDLEAHACGETPECTKYKCCYDTKKEAWETTNASVAAQEASLIVEYRALLRIDCLLKAFNNSIAAATSDLSAGIEVCRGTTFSAGPYVTYYDIKDNPISDCASKLAPGSQTWIAEYYSNLPEHTAFATCSASCCVAWGGDKAEILVTR